MSETEGQQVATGETGLCEKAAHEVTHASWIHRFHESVFQMATAATIDRIAADVASIKEKVDAVSPEDVAHLVESEKAFAELFAEQRDAAIRERDEARAKVERLRAEVEDDDRLIDQLIVGNAALASQLDEARAEAERLKAARDAANRLYGATLAKVERLNAELSARPAANYPEISDSSPAASQPAAPAAGWLRDDERDVLEDLACRIERWVNVDKHDADRKRLAALRSILARAGSPPVVEVPPFENYAPGVLHWRYRTALDQAGVPWKEVPRE